MNNLLTIVLADMFSKEAKKLTLPVGQHQIDTTIMLNVKAIVNRYEDSEYTPTVDIPLKATLAFLLQRMGFQRDKAIELLVEAMNDALENKQNENPADGGEAEDLIKEQMRDVDEAMGMVSQRLLENLTKKTRKGQTRVKGMIEEIQPEPVEV